MLSSTFTTQNSWGIRSNFPKGRQEWESEARKLSGLIFLKTFSLSCIIMFSLSTGPCPPAYKHILPSNLINSSTLHLSLLMDPWLCSPCGLLFFSVCLEPITTKCSCPPFQSSCHGNPWTPHCPIHGTSPFRISLNLHQHFVLDYFLLLHLPSGLLS